LKPGVPCVAAASQTPEAMRVIEATASALGVPLRVVPPVDAEVALSLRGPHQRQNAAVALACLEVIGVSREAALEGLRTARWPGRLEEVEIGGRKVLLDGAHNAAGAQALAAALDALYPGRKVHAVFSVLADKDLEGMARALFPRCASLHLCPLPSPRSLQPAAYAERARALCPDVRSYPSAREALAGASTQAQPDDVVLVAGSLVLAGEVRALATPGVLTLVPG
jgi:dihydrofolate synthase / folylpolyglutamate synthase